MMEPRDLPTDPAFAGLVEQAEIEAWLDLQPASPESRRLEATPFEGAILLTNSMRESPLSRVLGLGVRRPATVEMIGAILDATRAAGVETIYAEISPTARPGTLSRMLGQTGFRQLDRSVIVARDTSAPPEPDSYHRIRPATSDEHDAVAAFMHSVSGAPMDWCQLLADQVSRERWRYYVAWEHDEPCGLTGIHLSGDIAWLSVVWVSESFRNRGTQAALITHAIRDAEALGAKWITSSYPASVPGRTRNFDRLGFSMVYLRTKFIWEAGQS